jgi:hypothetical protein
MRRNVSRQWPSIWARKRLSRSDSTSFFERVDVLFDRLLPKAQNEIVNEESVGLESNYDATIDEVIALLSFLRPMTGRSQPAALAREHRRRLRRGVGLQNISAHVVGHRVRRC